MIPRPRLRLLVLGVAVALAGVSAANAQSLWIPRDRDLSVTLEVLKPSIEGFDESFSPLIALTPRVPLSSRVTFVGELPFARFKGTDEDLFIPLTIESSTIGNPYVGIEVAAASAPIFAEIGVRLPLMSEDEFYAWSLGILSDASRWEAFYPEAASIQPAFNIREVTPAGVAYRLRMSPTVVIPTDGSGRETELFAVYAWQIGYEGRHARIGTALSGRLLLTEDSGNLGERSANQLEVHADFGSWPVRPGLSVRLPLGEIASDIPVVWGVTLAFVR